MDVPASFTPSVPASLPTVMKCFQTLTICTLAISLASASGCSSKKDEDKERILSNIVPICERASESLASGNLDTDSFQLELENALKSCSMSCDVDHEASCTRLGEHLEILCDTMPDVCKDFCETAKGSIKSQSCKLLES